MQYVASRWILFVRGEGHDLKLKAAIVQMAERDKGEFDAFPFPPYDIQLGLMRRLYHALDQGHVGLFESPTGTGKTMSLIVACLTWLEDFREREAGAQGENTANIVDGVIPGDETNTAGARGDAGGDGQVVSEPAKDSDNSGDEEPDWMKSFASDLEREKRELKEKARAERLEKAARKEMHLNGGRGDGAIRSSKFRKTGDMLGVAVEEQRRRGQEIGARTVDIDDGGNDDDEFLLGDDDDEAVAMRRRLAGYLDNQSSSDDEDVLLSDVEEDTRKRPQVFFVSRTHSQLMQFVGELKKTRFHPGMSLVSLASRKQLCINPDVLKLGSSAMINERCMDLQNDKVRKQASVEDKDGERGKRKVKKCRCPYLKRNTKGEQLMKDMMLSEALDIEDLASLGKKRGICPYYAAREAAKESDIVLAPYSSLIMSDTRDSLGLDVGGSVVIVDEAHNLVDAINGGHSCVLSVEDVARATEQIDFYFQRFKTRLSGHNAKTVQTLLLAAKAISSKVFGGSMQSGPTVVMTTNKFLFDTSLDNVNMFQLGRDMAENKLIFKIGGYWKNRQSEVAMGSAPAGAGSGSLQALIEFLKKLTYDNQDGRIIVDPRERTVKYVMLNASSSFRQIVDQARSVVLASGTLSPLETIMPLFDAKPPEAIERYSCDHIVDPSRLLAMAVPSGPSGRAFDFRHSNRSNPALVADLGRALINVCNVTPGGVVVFFSSFSYCEEVMKAWGRADGAKGTGGIGVAGGNTVLEQLRRTKDVYVEPRSATDVEKVLTMYVSSIEKGNSPDCRKTGAVIFAVVGGKLAEGINFGDDMGRLVVMVGLPYPNPQDPELQERMRFMDRQAAEAVPPRPSPSKDYYVNLCMKAVNQCVGRAIRHINDYAAILLLDGRYVEQTAVSSRLSNWIGKSLRRSRNFGECQGSLVRFFKSFPRSDGL